MTQQPPVITLLTKKTRCMKRRSRTLEPRASLAPTGWGPKWQSRGSQVDIKMQSSDFQVISSGSQVAVKCKSSGNQVAMKW